MSIQISDMNHTPFQQRMMTGHENRTGHRADFVHVSSDGGKLWHVVRLCCGEPIPEAVPTFDDVVMSA